MSRRGRVTLVALLAALIAVTFNTAGGGAASPTYTLQVLHFYGESGTLGAETAPIMGALVDKFKTEYPNTLTLAEGDTWIPGPWLVGGADPSLSAVPGVGSTALGRPDVAILNALGVDASALGNHEFDLGSPVVQGAIAASGAWVGAQFPFITSNLSFAGDSSLRGLADKTLNGNFNANDFAGKEASTIKGKIAPYAVATIGGEKIGIVGATTWELLSKTSPNGTVPTTADIATTAANLQNAVDALELLGVNKIVLVDQLDTIERNKALAPLVSGIDIMVAGGGHERMGDATDTPAPFNGHTADFLPAPDLYPIVTSDMDGNPTLIVTTDTEFTYLGRLVAGFDAAGVLDTAALDPAVDGAYASTEATLQAAYGTTDSAATIIASSTSGSKIKAIADAINAVVTTKDGNKFGFSNVYLEGDRVFGRAQEVNLGDITADANIFKARAAGAGPFIVGLKNGGGLRASIGSIDEDGAKIANPFAPGAAGNVSQLDVENALRFDNKLMVFDTTPQGLLNILNYGAGLSPGNGGYPQVGGLRFSYDPSLAPGSRVRNVALYDELGRQVAKVAEAGVIVPGAPATIKVVILNFTANGGDGYPIRGTANGSNYRFLLDDGTLSGPIDPSLDFTASANVPANALGEQKAFQDYLLGVHGTPATAFDLADTPPSQDLRIQNLAARGDAVFDTTPPVITTPGDITVDATSPIGADVAYLVTVSDDLDPAPSLECSPRGASGGLFPFGTTTVTCNAEDSAGNTSSESFDVTVDGPLAQLLMLQKTVNGSPSLQSKKGRQTAKQLNHKLEQAYEKLTKKKPKPEQACKKLGQFVDKVEKTTGYKDGKLRPADAAVLIDGANRIEAVLGCAADDDDEDDDD